jgi:hypothetical protein
MKQHISEKKIVKQCTLLSRKHSTEAREMLFCVERHDSKVHPPFVNTQSRSPLEDSNSCAPDQELGALSKEQL